MINICLTRFTDDPWSKVVMQGFYKSLKNLNTFYNVEEIFGYPKKKYNLIILIGIRSIIKRNLEISKIIPFCDKLIDMGDDAMDPRRNYEDIYLYFNPSSNKLHDHYRYIPKFVLEEYLFIEPREDDTLNVYVDHFKCQNISEREQSVSAINKIFKDINSSNVKMNVFYHTSKGIEINRLEPEIPVNGVSQCSLYIPFEELSYYYRLTDVFLPTHRETQGMVAQEIGACGGITVLQEWMYPRVTHDQFAAMLYKHEQIIDFNFIKKVLTKFNKEDIRNNTLAKCGFAHFQNELHKILKELFNE